MMPTWLLTAWHVLSIASAAAVLMILCWHALRDNSDLPPAEEGVQPTARDEKILDTAWKASDENN
jgi:hypothetical protein